MPVACSNIRAMIVPMNRILFHTGLIAAASVLLAAIIFAPDLDAQPQADTAELKPGGDTTVPIKPSASFMLPAQNLAADAKPLFHSGKALAHQPWVKAPTTTGARDGLGPLYNARTCLMCHVNGGRGIMPNDDKQLLFTNFVRLSLPGYDPITGVIPEPTYGDQLQSQSTALSHQLRGHEGIKKNNNDVPPEAYVYIQWQQRDFVYPDGTRVSLRKPQPDIRNLGYGPMNKNTLFSIRNAPPIHGMGLLELIDQNDIDALADEQDRNGDGISGRVNRVWDFERKKTVAGRFGLKANRANLRIQIAAALQGDMGISNSIFSDQPCTAYQHACNRAPTGADESGLEITDQLLSLIVDFNRSIGVPQRRNTDSPQVIHGRKLFYHARCNGCHQPDYITLHSEAYPHLSQQHIWPYTDLLLHDMGPGLADQRPDYLANGHEWRTPPLWGVGLSAAVNGSGQYLHDGRARSIEEAILWHGGEARSSQQFFTQLSQSERQALIAFVESL